MNSLNVFIILLKYFYINIKIFFKLFFIISILFFATVAHSQYTSTDSVSHLDTNITHDWKILMYAVLSRAETIVVMIFMLMLGPAYTGHN